MKQKKFNPFLPSILALMSCMTSCIDNDYDLSDIDSTVRVDVNDLVVPINIDKITLANILDLKEGDRLQLVDGVYAVTEDGDFTSADIMIRAFHFPAPTVKSTDITISGNTSSASKGLHAPGKLVFNLATNPEQVAYHADNVPANIISLGKIGCNLNFCLKISIPQLGKVLGNVILEGVKLQLPRGLEFNRVPDDNYNYNPSTGVFTFNQAIATKADGTLELNFEVASIDAGLATTYHYDTHSLDFSSGVGIIGGSVSVDPAAINTTDLSSLSSVNLKVDYLFSDFDVTSVGGVIQYALDGFNVSDISLSNLPDILTQEGTSIGIENPQIFLSLNNPLNDYGVYASTGISITPVRDGVNGTSYGLDNGIFEIGTPHNTSGMYYYLLSPTQAGAMSFPEFPNPAHVGYTNLRYILEGNGIPQALHIDFNNPQLPAQQVSDLPLGQPLGHLEGKYKFVAPLQFTDGSTIVYTNSDTGWGSEDLDALTISRLEISMNITSDLPVGLHFTGYPIDADGNRINNVSIEGADIEPNAVNQSVTIRITGEVTGLDGVVFEARAYSANSSVLTPDMSILLNNIRPRVSGYYEKEL